MGDYWAERAEGATERKKRLLSFGPFARGVLVSTRWGLFAVDPEDSGVSATLLHEGSYGDSELEFATTLIGADSKVLVVGAHIGSLVIPLARRCGRVVAIEANPKTFEFLQANIRLSQLQNIEAHNFAAGERDGEPIEFLLSRDNSGGSKRRPVASEDHYMYDQPEIVTLETKRLDSVASGTKFDLIIMDIEGSEIAALGGMHDTLQNCRALAVEFRTHHIVDVAGADIGDFVDLVMPHFEWLYVPGEGSSSSGQEIERKLRSMFAANECHDVIYFFKENPSFLSLPNPL